jgi:sec-independent protein translocase protein TatB
MFGIDSTEFLLIVIVAVIVIGPKDLPRALYKVGQIIGKAQGMARHFRTGLDAMVREVEMEELEKKWATQNKRIMEKHPPETITSDNQVDAPVMEALPPPADEVPPFVAEAAPAPVVVADGPPYLAEAPALPDRKGDAAA